MPKQTLKLLEDKFAIHSFAEDEAIPTQVFQAPIFFIGKTYEELSIVCPEALELNSIEREDGWVAYEVMGPLAFSMTGIMSQISGVLADANISIFAISTFDTDYILVKQEMVSKATNSLKKSGYKVV